MNAEAIAAFDRAINMIRNPGQFSQGNREDTARELRDLKTAMQADTTAMQQQIEAGCDAVQKVIDNWSSGDLAGAVNLAESWLDDTKELFPDFDYEDSEADSEDDLPLIAVADLRENDMVDLEGDPYANSENTQHVAPFELFVVRGTERETDGCVRVDFDNLSVGFPPDHKLKTHRVES